MFECALQNFSSHFYRKSFHMNCRINNFHVTELVDSCENGRRVEDFGMCSFTSYLTDNALSIVLLNSWKMFM